MPDMPRTAIRARRYDATTVQPPEPWYGAIVNDSQRAITQERQTGGDSEIMAMLDKAQRANVNASKSAA
jgi:hypothetical protein